MQSPRVIAMILALGTFSLGLDAYVMAGLIPLLQQAFAVSAAAAAQTVTAFTLAYAIGSPLLVAFWPRHYQRLALLSACLVFAIANVASALACSYSFLLITRVVAGVSAGMFTAMSITTVTQLSGSGQQGKPIALVMMGMAAGTVVGVPVSLYIATDYGWQAVLWLVAAIATLCLLGLLCCVPALAPAARQSLTAKLSVLADKRVLSVQTVSLLAALASLGLYSYLAALIQVIDAQASVTPWLWLWGIGGIGGSMLAGRWLSRVGAATFTLRIMLLLSLSLLSLPLLGLLWPPLMALPLLIWGAVGWALQVPQNSELMRLRAAQGDGKNAVALNGSALYLGSALGTAAGGLWLQYAGDAWQLALLASAVAAVGAGVQWRAQVRRKMPKC